MLPPAVTQWDSTPGAAALGAHSARCWLLCFLIQCPLYLSRCLFLREPGTFGDRPPPLPRTRLGCT